MDSHPKIKVQQLHARDEYDKVRNGTPENEFQKSTIEGTTDQSYTMEIVWLRVIIFASFHLGCIYGVYLIVTSSMWQTNLFAIFLHIMSGLGVTAGAHRLWAHRSYKANLLLRVFLAFLFTIANQEDIYEWSRNHRMHHKYSETDADPHNAKRGFFFAHVGWLLCQKHPVLLEKYSELDFSDLLADPVVHYHVKYFTPLVLLSCFVLPTIIPMYFWGETLMNAFLVAVWFRFCFTLNMTWLVNSAAHMWGQRPYDVNINPRENVIAMVGTIGEGFHNYHHTFPYDYAASEYGMLFNFTTVAIRFWAWLGLAYDLKTASTETIKARKMRTGQNETIKED